MPIDIDLFAIVEGSQAELPSKTEPAQTSAVQVPVCLTEDDWQADPVPVKLEKIRAAFLNSKTVTDIRMASTTMPIGDWLEMVVKLSPKNIQVQGAVSFKHMLEEYGPIDSSKYKPKAIDVEYKEISE